MLNAHWEFFRTIYEASRLVRTMEVIETNWCFVERFHRHSWEYSGEVKSMDLNHKQRILDLFAKKDAENAVIALDRCIDWGASIVRGKLSASTLSALEPDGTRR
ncbi:MAG: FCD domain-containing protein [Rhodospirillaceae bacterium]|nr:FCD domain-containing protein [Rhodospirillaceae bacterium]